MQSNFALQTDRMTAPAERGVSAKIGLNSPSNHSKLTRRSVQFYACISRCFQIPTAAPSLHLGGLIDTFYPPVASLATYPMLDCFHG